MPDPAPHRAARRLLAGLAASALLAASAAAGLAGGGSLDARYAIEVAGIRVADLALTVTEAEGGASSRLVMEAVGLAAAWSQARSQMATVMRRDGDRPPLPVRFEAQHSKRDRERAIAIRYDGAGAIVDLEVSSQGRPRPSEVRPELRAATLDPLTALERLRDWLPAAAAGRADPVITLPVFDGRKRLDLEARYVGAVDAEAGGGRPAHELGVRLIGRYGFDEDDAFIQLPDGDPPRPLRVLVARDGSLLPLRIEVPDRRAGPVISLVRDCRQARCPVPGG